MKLLLDNLPQSLQGQRETLARCLMAMNASLPMRRVILFGSHVRGEARPDSDVDLCLVSDEAGRQLAAAERCREALRTVRPRLSFTLVPITPDRLSEKRAGGDFFFNTILKEGVPLATED